MFLYTILSIFTNNNGNYWKFYYKNITNKLFTVSDCKSWHINKFNNKNWQLILYNIQTYLIKSSFLIQHWINYFVYIYVGTFTNKVEKVIKILKNE